MKNKKILAVLLCTFALTAAGCGKEESAVIVAPTATPAPTAAPTAVPATATPVPTSTPAPRTVGQKTSDSKFVYVTNQTNKELREIYLRTSGTEDWGKSLVASESSIKASEQMQMFYAAGTADSAYDMKLVDKEGGAYEIYSIPFTDMEKAVLFLEDTTAYLTYTSLADNTQKDTRSSGSTDSSDDSSEEYYDDSYDDGYYDDSYDEEYYDDSYDDGYYDDSYDDGYYDDSYDDGDYDDSYDDESYDDSYDDGYYDDAANAGYVVEEDYTGEEY